MEEREEINIATDAKFLSGAKVTYPSLVRKIKKKKGKRQVIFNVSITVPMYYTVRKIKIIFKEGYYNYPSVYSDGPSESKHRYNDDSLCMWYPKDKKDEKWVYSDGLLELLGHIQLHLFREAYWRDYGDWVGPEVNH